MKICTFTLLTVCVFCLHACSTTKPAETIEPVEPVDDIKVPVGEVSQTLDPEVTDAEVFAFDGVRTAAESMSLDGGPRRVVALWNVTSGSPDYLYTFGGGEAVAGSFNIKFAGAPPAEAINDYGVGVAIIGEIADGTPLLIEGRCDDCFEMGTGDKSTNKTVITGFADRYAVLWVDPEADMSDELLPDWMRNAPKGYSCGRGVKVEGRRFESFEQVDCSEIVLRLDKNFEFVNWT